MDDNTTLVFLSSSIAILLLGLEERRDNFCHRKLKRTNVLNKIHGFSVQAL